MTSFSAERTQKEESSTLIKPSPEVIANNRLDHTKLVISVPTYHGEWRNGVLVRNLLGVLSQNVPPGEAIEINYVFNMDGQLPAEIAGFQGEQPIWEKKSADDAYWEKRQIADQAIAFLRQVVQVQAQPELATTFISQMTDEVQKKVLELAAKNNQRVAVSVVNALDTHISSLGYMDNLSGYRTMGMDYADARLSDEGVFLLFDSDALPQDNQFANQLLAIFDANPETQYMILRLAFQTSGVNKTLVKSSPAHTFSQVNSYSTSNYAQTTQMAFRKSVFPQLKEIMDLKHNRKFRPGPKGEEDRDTAMRLLGLFADATHGMLYQVDRQVGTLPVSLVEDRVDGIFDGDSRAHSLTHEIPSHEQQLAEISKILEETKVKIEAGLAAISDPELQLQLTAELAQTKKDFLRKQTKTLRFNRCVVKDFLDFMDHHPTEVVLGSHDWLANEEIQKQLAAMPSGIALLTYLTRNQNLLDELTPDDVEVMRFCVRPNQERPEVMGHLNDFQKSLIEYLGYMDLGNGSQVPAELYSTLQPKLAELLAYSHIFSLYQQGHEFYGDASGNPMIEKFQREMREDITHYPAVQDKRNTKWLQPRTEKPNVEQFAQLVQKIFGAIGPKFTQFLERFTNT